MFIFDKALPVIWHVLNTTSSTPEAFCYLKRSKWVLWYMNLPHVRKSYPRIALALTLAALPLPLQEPVKGRAFLHIGDALVEYGFICLPRASPKGFEKILPG